jgi:prolipoprotein diacylglyceryltransferase
MTTAAVLAVVGTLLVAVRRGVPIRRALITVLAGGVGAAIGARLVGAAGTGTSVFEPSFGAFSIWGAVGGGLVAGSVSWPLSGRVAVPAGIMLDAAVVPAGLAIGVARTGCMCAGCCFGLPTHLPWGITYPSGSNAHVANLGSSNLLDRLFLGPPPVHPVPVYDGGSALIAAGVAWWVHHRFVRTGAMRPGTSGAVFIGIYASARAIIEIVRYHPPDPQLLGAGGWQALFCVIAVGAAVWTWRGRGYSVSIPDTMPAMVSRT